MTERIGRKEVVQRLARRMNRDESTSEIWLDAVTDTLYEAFKKGSGVTLPGFGSFYVRPEPDSWVFKFNPAQRLRAMLGWSSSYKGEI